MRSHHMPTRLHMEVLLTVGLLLAGVPGAARASLIPDPVGDFLPSYTGVQDPGLDVVAHEVVLAGDRLIFFGQMAGPIAATQAVGGVYVTGLDRGAGTARFLTGTPVIGPNVLWDSVVRINPNGTGSFVNIISGGVSTPLNPLDISITGNEYVANLPLSLFSLGATKTPDQWTYNLWPRNGQGQNVQVSDLGPDDGNSAVVPEPTSLTLCGIGVVGLLYRWQRRGQMACR